MSAIGFGAMGLSPVYGAARTDDESREVVKLVSIDSWFVLAPANLYDGENRRSNLAQVSSTRQL